MMSESQQICRALPPIGLLAEVDEELRTKLAKAGRLAALPAGTRIATQGEEHRTLTVLLSGQARASCPAHGDYAELGFVHAGETIGEVDLIDPHKGSADVVTTERADICTIDDAEFNHIVETDPRAAFMVLKWLGRQLYRRLRANFDKMLRNAKELREHFRDIDY